MKLNEDIKFAILMIVVFVSMASAFFQPTYSVTYDCRIAEISPDIPPAVKEQCRKKMSKHLQPQKGL